MEIISNIIICFFKPTMPFFVLGVVLVVVKLRFLQKEAEYNRMKFGFLKVIKRTKEEVVDYLCWILLIGGVNSVYSHIIPDNYILKLLMLPIYGINIKRCFVLYFKYSGDIKMLDLKFSSGKRRYRERVKKTRLYKKPPLKDEGNLSVFTTE